MSFSSFETMQEFPHLLSPLTIGNMTVRNRILVSAHVPGFAEHNKPGEKYLAYQRTYAKNGVGLQITGGTPVHHSGLLGTTGTCKKRLLPDSRQTC